MKLSYIAPYSSNFPSRDANSIHVMRMCEAFVQLGYDVTLIVSSRGASESEIFEYYGMEPCFPVRQITVPRFKGKSVLYWPRAFLALYSLKPDVVVGRSVHVCALAAFRGFPVVYDTHGPVWEKGGLEYLAYQFLRRSRNLVRMTTNSSALRDLCISSGQQPRSEIVVANNGSLALPLDDMPDYWPGREGSFQVGYMGHLYPGRGIENIIFCAEQLSDMDFHVVGGTDEDISLWRRKAPLPNLFFHGFIKHSETHRYRNRCDVLLAPYQRSVAVAGGKGDSSRYMNPIKIIEYMSTKTPIIASNLPALREMLTDGNNALLCDPEDMTAWQQALVKLKEDAGLSKRLAQSAYDDFVQDYTWHARARRLIKKGGV
ncbi:glycosyltransferase [Natronospirillum operosum]|uniref:Glycosyltransferase n=1 Tax=Natronospirillum operosum TaxID=2759953 RepID=A0A4Z0WBR3_9GAMM|nr:glycosyltransferase family 4 protein [Natronospirillum operosum]TGG95254.1 glycosyltransferase [Natronospirillum operosum]